MRYTLISDIHADLPALDAVLAHITQHQAETPIYHLGDLVGTHRGLTRLSRSCASRTLPEWQATTTRQWRRTTSTAGASTRMHGRRRCHIGHSKDGGPRAGYALLDVSEAGTTVQFVRVEYNVERAARGILESTLPDDFAAYLRTGGRPHSAVISA